MQYKWTGATDLTGAMSNKFQLILMKHALLQVKDYPLLLHFIVVLLSINKQVHTVELVSGLIHTQPNIKDDSQ